MNTQNKRHPHAEQIKAWADGATIQIKKDNGEWEDCLFNRPAWNEKTEYRIKPAEPSNEPWKPKEGDEYWALDNFGNVFFSIFSNSDDENRYSFGNCFRTRAEAEAAAERVKAALKGEVGDKVMSREEADSAMRSAIGMRILADNNTSLERENKALKNELETLQIRNENLRKAKEVLIYKQTKIDGKPLSNGEKELIKALRHAGRITDVYDYRTTVLVSANDNASGVYTHRQHIAFFTSSSDTDDELIIRALKQIKAEQEAQNEA